MKKNYLFRTAMCLGIATVLSLCMTAGTYAKYTASISSKENIARVAKFDFSLKGTKLTQSTDATINLFDTVMDVSNSTNDANIDDGSTEVIIAPGSWGYVDIEVENLGEVTSKMQFTGIETNSANIPVVYAVSTTAPTSGKLNGSPSTWYTNLSDAISELNTNSSYFGDPLNTSAAKTVYLCWMWEFEMGKDTTQSDSGDTNLGVTAASGTANTVSVTLTCTATQVD